MKENQLPKYFVVKRDDANPLWRKYIDWLNKTYLVDWPGFSLNYYGYDGSIIHKGTNAHDNIERFENSPTLLTLDEWDAIVNPKELKVGDKVELHGLTHEVRCSNYGFWAECISLKNCSVLHNDEVFRDLGLDKVQFCVSLFCLSSLAV